MRFYGNYLQHFHPKVIINVVLLSEILTSKVCTLS